MRQKPCLSFPANRGFCELPLCRLNDIFSRF
nr:MAG TPA: hypothetical protein [Caudoviricetes sp.]